MQYSPIIASFCYDSEFTKSLDLDWDATGPFGGVRGKRYALKVVDGKVAEAHVEPDNAGFNGRWTPCLC